MATPFASDCQEAQGKLPDTSDEDSSDDWKPSSGNAGKKKSKSEDPEKKQLEEQVRALQAENARLAAAKRDGRKEPHEAVEWIVEQDYTTIGKAKQMQQQQQLLYQHGTGTFRTPAVP